MKSIGVDTGTSRCGIAVSDGLGMLARPAGLIESKGGRDLAQAVADRAATEEAGAIVVGLPLNMDGSEGPRAQAARRFAADVKGRTSARVLLLDERLTTVEAERRLFEAGHDGRGRKGLKDAASAAVLLQAYLDGSPGMDV